MKSWNGHCIFVPIRCSTRLSIGEKDIDPLQLARRMLKDFTRGLFIEMKLGNPQKLLKKACEITDQFDLRLERTEGSLAFLRKTLQRALKST